MKTHVLIFQANIGGQTVSINVAETYEAIKPNEPTNERPFIIDLTQNDDMSWEEKAEEIKKQVDQFFKTETIDHLSIFALAPIPLTIMLGTFIGDKISANLYQHHRDTNDWKWKNDKTDYPEYRIVTSGNLNSSKNKKVALLLSLSQKVHRIQIGSLIDDTFAIYEMEIDKPSPTFLSSEEQLGLFRKTYTDLLAKIGAKYGTNCKIHLFAAIPNPISIECGRLPLPKAHPTIFIYDYKDGYKFTLSTDVTALKEQLKLENQNYSIGVKHLKQKHEEFDTLYDIISEKIKLLREECAIVTDTSKKFEIEKNIKNLDEERNKIVKEMEAIEQQLGRL